MLIQSAILSEVPIWFQRVRDRYPFLPCWAINRNYRELLCFLVADMADEELSGAVSIADLVLNYIFC
jgi:hypothetical protein